MLTDALGKPVRFIIDTILEMIDNYYSNNVMANEDFLDHLYRIVSDIVWGSKDLLLCATGWMLRSSRNGGLLRQEHVSAQLLH